MNDDERRGWIFRLQILGLITLVLTLYCAQGWVWWKLGQANGIKAGRAEMLIWRGYHE